MRVIYLNRMHSCVVKWSSIEGLAVLSCVTQAYAQVSTPTSSSQLERAEMSDDITPSQERALLRLLDKVMEVMRDDRPLEPDDPAFGELESAAFFKLAEAGKTYTFRNNAFPDATVDLTTWTDPLDYSDDRTR